MFLINRYELYIFINGNNHEFVKNFPVKNFSFYFKYTKLDKIIS